MVSKYHWKNIFFANITLSYRFEIWDLMNYFTEITYLKYSLNVPNLNGHYVPLQAVQPLDIFTFSAEENQRNTKKINFNFPWISEAPEKKDCKLVCYISKYDIVKLHFFINFKQSNTRLTSSIIFNIE